MVSISLSSDRAIRRRWSSTFAETDADPLLVAVDPCFAAIDTSSMFFRGSRRCRATADSPQSVREPEAAREPKGLSALGAYPACSYAVLGRRPAAAGLSADAGANLCAYVVCQSSVVQRRFDMFCL